MKHFFAISLLTCLTSAPAMACQVGLAEYNQLKVGMTQTQVFEVVGCQGMVRSSQTVEDFNTKIIAWKDAADGMGQVDVMFQSGALVSKTHYGLQ